MLFRSAFYKDFVVVETAKQSLKESGKKRGRVVLHFHNKGVYTKQERWFDNILYNKFFKDVNVILLAESLYGDISKYVERNNVAICGNGIPDNPDEHNVVHKELTNEYLPHLLFLSNMMTTGLVTVVTGEHWSLFGQVVILVMIQMGGLGVVSFTTFLLMIAGKRIQLKQRMLIQEAYGFDTLTGMVRMVRATALSTCRPTIIISQEIS